MNVSEPRTQRVLTPQNVRWHRFRALWIPILVLELYLVTTVAIFFFGPVDWHVPNTPKLILFLAVNYGALAVGYARGIRKGRQSLDRAVRVGEVVLPSQILWLILWSMILTIVFCMIRLATIRGGVSEVLSTIFNPGEAYQQAQAIAQLDRDGLEVMGNAASNFRWLFRASTLLAVFNGLFFPLMLIAWKQVNLTYRLLFVVAVLSSVLFAIGVGAQSGIGFLVFSALPVALYRLYVMGKPLTLAASQRVLAARSQRLSKWWVRASIGCAILLVMGTVVFFQVDRQEATGRRAELQEGMVGNFGLLSNTSFLPFQNERLNFGLAMLCFYVSHGYEGLALSMELPFEWTYGIGWSKALQVILHEYLGGPDVFEKSYLARNEAETGWYGLFWWSTIFPWLASDTSYYGTFLFMLLIGWTIGRCWSDAIVTGNPMAFALLAQMFILVFMFPANNALAQTLDALFSLVGVLVLYKLSSRFYKRRVQRKAPAFKPVWTPPGVRPATS